MLASLRVAPVPLRAFDLPCAPDDPGCRSAPRNGPFSLTKEWLICGALLHAGLRPSLTSGVRADLRDGRWSAPIEQRNRKLTGGSGWHGDGQIKPLACLQHAEAEDQWFAH